MAEMATLKEQVQRDLTDAMRGRDEVAVATLRMLLAAVTKAEVAGKTQVTLDDAAVQGIVRTEIRRRGEAAELYEQGGRDELATRERAEADVLTRYLPPELSDEELTAIVDEEVARSGAEGPKAMGQVVKAVRERVGAAADGARIAATVKAALGLG
ncbi:MAG TPA: GatB/YqeY domain-containing protein [Acidimicrobiia bacterium]|jgi:hypothetical protein